VRDSLSSEQVRSQGEAALARGDFETGLGLFREANRLASDPNDPAARYSALMGWARAERELGEYLAAQNALVQAIHQAELLGDPSRQAAATVALGGIELARGEAPAAEATLRAGAARAADLGLPVVEAAALNDLGNLNLLRGEPEIAGGLYRAAAELASAAGDPGLAALAWANGARASEPQQALAAVQRAEEALARVPDSHDRAALLLNLGLFVGELAGLESADREPEGVAVLRARSEGLLESARAVAEARGDARIEAHALAALGGLEEDAGRIDAARALTRRALASAGDLDAPELVYRWHAQRGRLLVIAGDRPGAIAAYERAVALMQLLRDRPGWGAGLEDSSFEGQVAPVYRALLDLLLLEAAESPNPGEAQAFLVKARAAMEEFKAAELRDFFRDDCVDAQRARTRGLGTVSPDAAIVYPILLPGRTALLISAPGRPLELVSVPISRQVVEAEVRALREQLERPATRRYLVHAQRLYDWLIRPLEASIEASGVGTLVFVPDGPLLTIPLASLHDGDHFLVEEYAVATTPGFDLVDPAAIDREGVEALLAGISKSVDGAPPLPNVVQELRAVESLVGGQVMLDDAFVRSDLRDSLEEKNFGIIHIATHARFSARPEDTYLLAFDGRLSLDELSEDVGLFRFRDTPLELLTLSACETARGGGERAGLGLSGMAVRAGARSVLGSLWSVNDPAVTALIEIFYTRLMAGDSRAQALRAAQLGLMADFRYRHPAYWAPFLLIGTWL
jgi:CHAT domain-containing protein